MLGGNLGSIGFHLYSLSSSAVDHLGTVTIFESYKESGFFLFHL